MVENAHACIDLAELEAQPVQQEMYSLEAQGVPQISILFLPEHVLQVHSIWYSHNIFRNDKGQQTQEPPDKAFANRDMMRHGR